jgi:cytochrome c556
MWPRSAAGMVTTVLLVSCSGHAAEVGSAQAGVAEPPGAGAGMWKVSRYRSASEASPAAIATATKGASGEPETLPFEVTASLQELMRDEVDASADAIWDSVGTTTTRNGSVEKQPRSDEDWQALRRQAVVLLEATNLLVIPGRRVAQREFPSDGPGVFSSQQIQTELRRRQPEFNAFAQGLRGSGRRVLAAIDSRDVDALLKEGAVMDNACEACHRSFWYPQEVVPTLPAEPPQP